MSGIRSLFCCAGGEPSSLDDTKNHEQPREAPSLDATDSGLSGLDDEKKLDSEHNHHVHVEQQPPQLPEKMSLSLSFDDNRSSTNRWSRDVASLKTTREEEREKENTKRISDELGKDHLSVGPRSIKEEENEGELFTHDWAQAVLAAALDESPKEETVAPAPPKPTPTPAVQESYQSLEPKREEEPSIDTDASRFETYSGFNGWATTSRISQPEKPAEVEEAIEEPKPEEEKVEEKPVATIIPPVQLLPSFSAVESVSPARPTVDTDFKPLEESAPISPITLESAMFVKSSPVSPTETLYEDEDMTPKKIARSVKTVSRSATPTQETYPSRSVTPTPQQIEDEFNPTRDPRRASTLSTISNIIAPAAAAAALKRQSATYVPQSRPASPTKRFSQLSITTMSRSGSVRSVRSVRTNRFSGGSSLRPYSALSSYTTASRVDTPEPTPEEDEDEEEVQAAVPVTINPADHPGLTEHLQPLVDIVLPVLDGILANTSVLSQYALWESTMTLRREIRAFIASGVEDYLCVNDAGEIEMVSEDIMAKHVRAFVERGDKIKKEVEKRNLGGAPQGEGRLMKVRSFWMDKAEA
ncbi:hypothetical protein EDC01DRAFT_780333 [Geopyxis carbonaria]|nr:hypothetical protein EDC01DRAFT_780333 [Geopyxis carbonaria]